MEAAQRGVPTISILIVTYQSAKLIDRCLDSIATQAGLPVEILVVDNDSTDGTRDLVAARRAVRLIPLETNRGFTAAVNVAASRAMAPYLLLLNPDAELLPNALPNLYSHLEAHPRVAAVGPKLIYPDGTPQDAAFTYPSLLMTWLEYFPRPGRLIHSRWNGRISSSRLQAVSVDYPLGACILIRRSAWEDVGGLDEGFFMYCEEIDWCMRAKRRGWGIEHLPSATVVHHSGASTQQNPDSLLYLHRSRRRLHQKYRGPVYRFVAALITRLGLMRERRTLQRLQTSPETADPHAQQRIEAIERVLRSALA